MSSRPSRGAARLAAILDALPDALLLVNRNGTVVNANAMALEALEAPGTPIVGRGLLDLLPTFDRSRIPGSVRIMDTGDTRTKPTRMTARRTDGSVMPVEVTSANLPGAYDDELLMIVVRDLSGSVDVESELQRQQRQTEMILRAATEGIVGIDADGSIVLVNPAAARILRRRAGDLGGKPLHKLLQPKKADGTPLPEDECPALVTLKTGRKLRLRDQVLWRGDGEPLPVEMTTAPILLGEAVVGAVMTFTDLSRERALTEHREQLAELLDGELLARIDAARAKLKTLADGSIGELGPSARRVVRQVASELEEMAGLTGEVLEHQRGEVQDEAERTAATLDDLLDRALETVTYPARAAGVEFTVTAAPVGVQVDVDAMTRALGHLIADTVGAGPKGSTVVVAAAQRGAVARIEVRGPASRGSSVHVPLARAVIEAHGGTVESHIVEGRGSTYVVELPADEEAAAKARPQDSAEAGQDGRARARKRARTSPAVRPGTAKPGTAKDSDKAPDAATEADAKKDAKDPKGAPDNPTPQLPAARSDKGADLEPRARLAPAATPAPGVPPMPAPTKPIALPAGDSTPPGTAPSVPLVPASGRRAARRALPSAPSDEPSAQDAPAPTDNPGDGNRDGSRADNGTTHQPGEGTSAEDAAKPPTVPAKVNGHHTRHMARARHHLSTPPASIPSQPRPGLPGMGSRSTSVQDRPESAPSDIAGSAPTELLGLPAAAEPPVDADADAPTAPMPQIPAPPADPPQAPQTPPAIPPMPTTPPPMPGADVGETEAAPNRRGSHSAANTAEPELPGRAQASGRRRRAAAQPAQPPQSAPQPQQEQPGGPPPQAPDPEAPNPQAFGAPGAFQDESPALPSSYQDLGTQGTTADAPPGYQGLVAPGLSNDDANVHAQDGSRPTQEQAKSADAIARAAGYLTEQPRTTQPHGRPAEQAAAAAAAAADDAALEYRPVSDPLPHRVPGIAPHPGTVNDPATGVPIIPTAPPQGHRAGDPDDGAGHDVDTPPPGELAAVDPDYPPMVAPAPDGRPRRLLVWPAPDGPTSGALTARGWDPVLVRSREEVDAAAPARPAALFVDPLTGPITRTALQSLRTAATAAEIPVLVTAGIQQATRDAAFGADPAVLLRSLAPADSAAHASRVLLVEANADIAAAFTGSLVRRGMDVVHVTSESEALSKASSVEPNLVVLDLMLVRRRRLGIVDWLRNNQRLHSTPIVVYTTVDIAEEDLPRLQTGETVLFLAERSTRDDVQLRVVDLLSKIASLV